ncbi:MEKHLA domain-containing protein [Prochlorococcus sp. MIT 1300]|uniref:MEKHLA domain-containing protein n=1 Tax=Prochlorococcus sp. MIT 1300 TaxID=3096218 RepID=UPI002A760062|nr:MEKHLA domain-containing protein [Prochlorococcus sp. MIT 1300]
MPPWLTTEKRQLTHHILQSHLSTFGHPLFKCNCGNDNYQLQSQELFTMNMPLMAHNIDRDPRLIYANAAALTLWCRQWKDMVGMPSRLTAPESETQTRKLALEQSLHKNASKNYYGIRIDSRGTKFTINNARIWTVWDNEINLLGQAATFNDWSYLYKQ